MSMKKRPGKKRVLLTALVSVLSVILVLLVGFTVYVEWVLGQFYQDPAGEVETLSPEQLDALLQSDPNETIDPNAPTIDPDQIEWTEAPPIETGEHIFNFMLIGQDRRPGEIRSRSDSMILLTVNTDTSELYVTSILRDMYVSIPGYGSNRINVPYAIKGADLLFDTLEKNFGLRPDKYIEVDFSGFVKAVDLVGGVDIRLTAEEARHLSRNEDFYGFPDEQWDLVEGVNHLTGSQALSFARCRAVDGTGDFGRSRRQRDVLKALIDKASTLSVLELNELLLAMPAYVTTDMSSDEIMGYAARFIPLLKDLKVINQRIPADGTYSFATVENVGSVIMPNLTKNRAILESMQR